MRIRTHLYAALAAFSFAVPSVAADAPGTERSTMLLLGNKAGFQEAKYAADGTVTIHYEYNDRGRGPKLDGRYRVGEHEIPTSLEITGVAYFKTPVEERYTRDAE